MSQIIGALKGSSIRRLRPALSFTAFTPIDSIKASHAFVSQKMKAKLDHSRTGDYVALSIGLKEGGLNVNFPLFAEKRLSLRKKLTGLLPGRLSLIGSKSFIACRPVDISRHGLGILTSERLSIGTKLILKLPDQEIQLEVQWGQPDFGKKDLFRYGLVTNEQGYDLEELFEKAGCLKAADGNS